MPAIRQSFHAAVAIAALAGCAATPPTQPPPAPPPSGATFAQWVTTGHANPETFDFSAAGYWRLTDMERIQWRQPTLDAAMRVFTGGVDPCTPDNQRLGASMTWMMLLTQSSSEAEWTENATALRARLGKLDVELAATKAAGTSRDPRVAELLERFARDQAIRGVITERKWMEGLPALAANNWGAAFASRWT